MSLPSPALAAVLVLATAAGLGGCDRAPDRVDVEMDTSAVARADVERALDRIRNACRPLFTRHAGGVTGVRAIVSSDGSAQTRRFGWGVYFDLRVALRADPETLPRPADREARFLAGGGARPGLLALSPTAAALCDQTLAPGRRSAFLAIPGLAEDLPKLVLNPTREQVAAYRAEEQRALTGDYQSQRNIAWCFIDGCYGVEPIDDVRACAWRLVIAAAKHPKSDASDVENVRFDCDAALSPDDRANATVEAGRLFKKIYKTDLPKAP